MAARGREGRMAAILAEAGITLNGDRPWDIRINNPALARRVARHGLVGLGDAYVDGWWDCEALDQFFERAFRADLPSRLWLNPSVVGAWLYETLFNEQSIRNAPGRIRAHYDMGNDIFEATLDPLLQYTCALWDDADTLDQAQEAKLDLICSKLGLRPGMTLLDIGCGWGGMARFAATRYGCSVVGVTLSNEQAQYARTFCRGLPVEVRLQDYRHIEGRFDRITIVGMFEHVGHKNHRTFTRTIRRLLQDDGLCLLHFFATQRSWPNLRDSEVLWIKKHIFPGMVVPSLAQVGKALDGLLVLEDIQNIGANYDRTLLAWRDNFHRNWPALRAKYGERLYRVWMHYLLSAAGAFRARKYQVWQLVLSPHGVPGGYRRPAARAADAPRPPVVVTAAASRRPAHAGEL